MNLSNHFHSGRGNVKTRELIKSILRFWAPADNYHVFVCFARMLLELEAVFHWLFQELLSRAAKAIPKRWFAITFTINKP